MNTYSAILFDMDGVLIDTQQAVTAFWNNVAQQYGISLTQPDFTYHIYGCPAPHTMEKLFPALTSEEKRAVIEKMKRDETTMAYTALDGAIELVSLCQQHAIRTALVTSADPWKIEAVFSQLELNGMFTALVGAKDIQNGKPDPECYLAAAGQLQQSPERCLVFEDAVSGVKAAVASGAVCIGVRQGESATALREAGAHCVIPDLRRVRLESTATQRLLHIGTACTFCVE